MINFLRKIFLSLKPKSKSEYIHEYLSESVDIADLKRRMKILDKKLGLKL